MPATATAKLLPPLLPDGLLALSGGAEALERAARAPIVVVVAGAGFGKTTLLASWASTRRAAWYTLDERDRDPLTLIGGLARALERRLPDLADTADVPVSAARGPGSVSASEEGAVHVDRLVDALRPHLVSDHVVLVIDDVHELDAGSPSAALVESLCRQLPAGLQLVLSSRAELPFHTGRMRAQGRLREVAISQLRLSVAEIGAMLAGELGPDAEPLADLVFERTGGWPASVRLGVEALHLVPPERRHAVLAEGSIRSDEEIFDFLGEDVIAGLEPELVEMMRVIAPLDTCSAELMSAIGAGGDIGARGARAGGEAATDRFARLERRGVFLVPLASKGWYRLQPQVRAFIHTRMPLDDVHRARVVTTATQWYETHGVPEAALECAASNDIEPLVAQLLDRHGDALIATGAAAVVIQHCRALGAAHRSERTIELEASACFASGSWDEALACFRAVVPSEGAVDPAQAWRAGLIHYLRGDLDVAIDLYERGLPPDGPTTPDTALVLGWHAAARWLRGDLDEARRLAEHALDAAESTADDAAAAVAHVASALVAASNDDRRTNDVEYAKALVHAERAGDVLQVIRIHANRGSRNVEEGDYEGAIIELDEAVRLAEVAGYAVFKALAQHNRGDALLHLGRLEEAFRDLTAARATYETLGSASVAYPLFALGEVHRIRGDVTLSRIAFDDALRVAEEAGDLQGTVPPLIGLAMLSGDAHQAADLAARAASDPTSLFYQRALATEARLAAERGELDVARQRLHAATESARARRDRRTLAECLVVSARLADDRPVAIERLGEARVVLEAIGDVVGVAEVELELVELGEGDASTCARVAELARTIGARPLAERATRLLDRAAARRPVPVAIAALGGFRVERGGMAIAPNAWQSRKARDLLKILVARRGNQIHREELIAMLWPEDESDRGRPRLSVILSTLRSVLADGGSSPESSAIASDRSSVWLRLERVRVDVEHFLADASAAIAADRNGADDALERLTTTEARYTGDAFADDPYAEWAIPLRETVRATHREILRRLADRHRSGGDADGVARYLLRSIEQDPFDERAHLDLVECLDAAGRHGDAGRAFRTYCARMEELGVEPASRTVPARSLASDIRARSGSQS